jgi:hypothetical protein
MQGLTPLIATIHMLLLAGFVIVTVALLGLSVVNRLRIRNAVATWRPTSWKAFPLGPILFTAVVVGFEVVSLLAGRTIPPTLLLGYGAGSLAWFAAAYLSSVVVVTECGVMADIHRRDLCIAWGQITDYFEFEKGRRRGFVFFYRADNGIAQRLDVDVPARLMPLLSEHVERRLQCRFESAELQTRRSRRALEG